MISRLLVVQEDSRTAEAVRYGFEREGATVVSAPSTDAVGALVAEEAPELIVAGAESPAAARGLLTAIREALERAHERVPVLYLGNAVDRSQALEAGASEFLPQPAFLRDVVTVGKLLASPKRSGTGATGELADYHGIFYMVRALAALGRSGVLTLTRGLRRGELRFYEGEVTSAQVGVLHGQAALHQLLLWTEAHFELRYEPVVRRRQIPLAADEILADAERFLEETRAVAGGLSPSAVYEQDPDRVAEAAATMPTEVHGVLRLFDGRRTIADVVEDSSFRVFETLRIAARLRELAVIRRAAAARGERGERAALDIDEWLVGNETPVPMAPMLRVESEPVGPRPGQPASPPRGAGKDRGGRKRGRAREAAPPAPVGDWSQLLPSTLVTDVASMSPVVPATEVVGEILVRADRSRAAATPAGAAQASAPADVASVAVEREGLETVAEPETLSRLFDGAAVASSPAALVEGLPAEPVARVGAGGAGTQAATAVAPKPETRPGDGNGRGGGGKPKKGKKHKKKKGRGAQAAQAGSSEAPALAAPAAPVAAAAQPTPNPSGRSEVESALAAVRPAESAAEPVAQAAPEPVAQAAAAAPIAEVAPEPAAEAAPEPAAQAAPEPAAQAAPEPAAQTAPEPVAPAAPEPAPPATAHPATRPSVDELVATADKVFSADEEAFFAAGHDLATQAPPPAESFEDLDRGYQRKSFWQRLLGRDRKG